MAMGLLSVTTLSFQMADKTSVFARALQVWITKISSVWMFNL